MGKFFSMRARFVACALGQAETMAPSEEGGADWDWAKTAVGRIDEIMAGSLRIDPATPEGIAAIRRVVAREGFLVSQELARRSLEAGGSNREIRINGLAISRPTNGKSALALKRGERVEILDHYAFDMSGSRRMDSFNELAEKMAPAGMRKLLRQAAMSEEVAAVAGAIEEAVASWKSHRARQCGTLMAEMAGRMLFPDPATGRDAAILRCAASFHQNDQRRDPLTGGLPEAAMQAACEAPHAAALFAAMAPALRRTTRAEAVKEMGASTIMEFKEQLKLEYGVSGGAWRALLDLAAQSEEFPAALATMIDNTLEPRGDAREPRGSRLPLANGEEPCEKQAELFSAFKAIALAKLAGAPVRKALEMFHPELISGDVSSLPASGDSRREAELWSSLTGMLTHAPRGWRVAGAQQGFDKAWAALAEKAGCKGAPKLDQAAFAAMREKAVRPESPLEAQLMALDNDRVARAEKAPALIASAMRWTCEDARTPEERREAQSIVDFMHSVELGFWSQAPLKISMGWLRARSEEWHDAMSKAKASRSSWAPATEGEIDCGNGWTAVELSTGEALAKEGREMSHCVSGYARQCSEGASRIFSLRSEASGQRSTIEMAPEWQPNQPRTGVPLRLSIVQHMGEGNSVPSIMAKAAARRMEASIAKFLSAHAASEEVKVDSPRQRKAR